MSNESKIHLQQVAETWRIARRIYPIYAGVIALFKLSVEPCRHLESPIDRDDPEALAEIEKWLDELDGTVEAAQLRQVLQGGNAGTEPGMLALLQRYLAKPDAAPTHRDKIDFLAAQYFTHVVPLAIARGKVRFDEVARVLQPVVGAGPFQSPPWSDSLDLLISKLDSCESLRDLISEGLLEEGREFKNRTGAEFTSPAVLVAFTRYNFLVRRTFIRLLHNDLEALPKIIDELQKRNVKTVDCRQAGLSQTATLDEVRLYCRNWKSIFRAEFSERAVCTAVARVLEACDNTLAESPVQQSKSVTTSVVAAAAPAPAPEPAPEVVPVPTPSLRFTVEQAQADIHKQLAGDEKHQAKLATGTITLGETRSLLSSWEVAAFLKGNDSFADALQHAVAARAIIVEAIERAKKGEAVQFAPVVSLGHAEASRLQEQIAQARDARNIDAAVNLAATHKRLLQIVDQLEKSSGGRS